ncbi:MAG: hypothetical protein F4X36_09070 [Gammaproteobacteria bacterium]|nr:hypothetical protein [Gammaproteobacteria bacterium]
MVLFTVFVLGFLEISLPLPIVIVMGGAMEPAFALIGISGSAGTLFFIYLSQPVRRWVVRRWGMDSVIFTRTERFMVRYGAVGVGLLAPMILGHALTAVAAVVLGAPTRKLALWMIVGVWLWTVFYYAVILAGATWIVGVD